MIKRIDQRSEHMLLPHQIAKYTGALLSVQDLITNAFLDILIIMFGIIAVLPTNKYAANRATKPCHGVQNTRREIGGDPASHTPAHGVTATVAPFRAWRSSRLTIARGPTESPLQRQSESVEAAHYPEF